VPPASPPADTPPSGYRPVAVGGDFVAGLGPLYARWEDGVFSLGLRVQARHCNPIGHCHGGMLATLADMLLPYAAMYQLNVDRRFTPTVSLQLDYLAPAPLGAWIEGRAEVLRSTRRLLFVQGVACINGAAVLRASGIFKWGEADTGPCPRDPFGLR
jgi:uncharacterized protein (TIGR00369 family)